MSFFFNITISQHFCHPQFLNPPISSIPRLICSSRISDQCRIGALAQPRLTRHKGLCCGRTGSHPRNHPGKNLLSDLCPATVCTSALQQIIKSTSSIPSTPISFCPLCSPHLVDPHKTYQQQVKGLSASHHFILNINNRTFTKSSFGWMESRP